MYRRIRDNLISPKNLFSRRTDKVGITLLYFFLLVLLLSVSSIVGVTTYNGLTANNKSEIKSTLAEQVEVPCTIDNGLTCEINDVYEITYANFNVYLDPAGSFAPDDFGVNVVLQEEVINLYSAGQLLSVMEYENTDGLDTMWPSEWSQLVFDGSDTFWDTFFLGLGSVIDEYRGVWIPMSIIISIVSIAILLLSEILLDTLIISLFRLGGLKFGETFKLVINASTAYVLLSVILDLYNINTTYFMRTVLQMIPVIYVVLAIRSQRGELDV